MEIVFAKLARTHERSYEYLQTCRFSGSVFWARKEVSKLFDHLVGAG
jgi:hypothetical protein